MQIKNSLKMNSINILLLVLPLLASSALVVEKNDLKCPDAESGKYSTFAYSEQRASHEFTSTLLSISVVQQNGAVSKVHAINQPFNFVTIPLPQYVWLFQEPIMGPKNVTSDLAKLVAGRESAFLGERSRIFMVDNCALKNSTALPNIVVKLGNAQKSDNWVLTPQDYVLQHPKQGYCYFAFYYLIDNDYWKSTDLQARKFCDAVDTQAKLVGFARPVA